MTFIRSACAGIIGACLISVSASADDGHGPGEQGRLHFAHPLIAESPSPDTKVRLDYKFTDEPGSHDDHDEAGANRHTVRFEGEYAFAPWISVEVNAPYTFLDPEDSPRNNRLDTVEVGIKLASFAFAEHGLLIGGGIEFGLPTGNDALGIGSNNVIEIEPFVDFGYRSGRLETVGFLSFGIPANEKGENEVDIELGWNLSFLYRATDQTQLVLEFDGENAFGGEEDGEFIVNVTPGIKVSPPGSRLAFGAGLSVPLTGDKGFNIGAIFSLFYHF